MRRSNWSYHLLVLLLVGLDQLTKAIVVQKIFLFQKVEVIPGLMNLTRIHNRGIIFGAFSNLQQPTGRLILGLVSFFALALVTYYYFKIPASEGTIKFPFSLILSGALGNLIDRMIRGYVVDFVDFHLGPHHWPTFNLADSCITIGGLLLIIFLFKPQRREACSLFF